METIVNWLVEFVHTFGYVGIFVMTFLESTCAPVPSEVTMIPAGYLVQQGHMDLFWVLFSSVSGTLCGSLFMYWFASHFGRRFLYRYGKYFFFKHERMEKLDKFFGKHGEISIFTGRLIPGVRHVISFPAGLAQMNLKKFCLYTGLGGSLWMSILVAVGYIIGDNSKLIHEYMPYITTAVVGTVFLLIVLYVAKQRKKMKQVNRDA